MASFPRTLRLTTCLPRQSGLGYTSIQLQAARTKWKASSSLPRADISIPPRLRTATTTQRRWAATDNRTQITPPSSNPDEIPPATYSPPTTGVISRLPPSWIAYAELIRLDKPAGTYYLFLPCLFSTLLAASLATPITSPLTVLSTGALFFAGALVMRGAGCTINDLWDRNLDPHVERTRLRPIARGAITVNRAIPFLGLQLFTGLAILLQFPSQCFFYATPSLVLVTLYPLAKRITTYPQFVLGLTFSWGAIMGFPALGIDLLTNTSALASAACLYGSCVAWTLIYDMIYAYQDIRDDAKVGILSIARTHEANAKQFLAAVSAVQVGLLAGAGYFAEAGMVYYFLACGGAGATLDHMIREVKLDDVADCASWFRRGAWATGGVISGGMFLDCLANYFGVYGPKKNVAAEGDVVAVE
ncbi:hypothetical protein LTR62_007289 [Meristemomyces frigidus]|uniref:4-hydroxybenzoate polyprenyltransferase, mitochondrial n=1 Tax=Meristemomyces frigidus TaxID=1508187 RepID=A0AAN7YMD8_9PEZI|nr:hypothetical protein LTR62_007289 [Meristemomyces frigidus]